jgi:hypothetical protein
MLAAVLLCYSCVLLEAELCLALRIAGQQRLVGCLADVQAPPARTFEYRRLTSFHFLSRTTKNKITCRWLRSASTNQFLVFWKAP